MSNLRTVIRDSIARGITLVLDEERFLQRICEVIAESSGYESVVAYVADPESPQLALGASSTAAPDWLPKRLPISSFQSVEPILSNTEEILGPHDRAMGTRSIVIPLTTVHQLEGVIVILDVNANAISEEDIEAFSIVAEEIAPAVRVASTHQHVRDSVVVDMATGAYTYDFFTIRLEQELSRATRTGRSVTIVLIEASHFDEFEHAAGYERSDQLLKDLSTAFTNLMRTSDVVARRGRTGFALLLPDSDVEGAGVTIQRIEDRLAQVDTALEEQGYDGPLPGIIAGSATFPTDGQTPSELILAADQRMLADTGSGSGAE
ncbi:MAG: GGDEF domain-containing protein [Thermomicrobiales bacterium]